MTSRQLFSIVLITFVVTIVAWLVKEFIQPNWPAKWNQALNYFIYVFPIVMALITGMIQGVAGLQSIRDGKTRSEKCTISNKRVAKSILNQLHRVGYGGVKADTFNLHIISEHPELSKDERTQICDELESCGYMQRDKNMVKITKSGAKYMKRWFLG